MFTWSEYFSARSFSCHPLLWLICGFCVCLDKEVRCQWIDGILSSKQLLLSNSRLLFDLIFVNVHFCIPWFFSVGIIQFFYWIILIRVVFLYSNFYWSMVVIDAKFWQVAFLIICAVRSKAEEILTHHRGFTCFPCHIWSEQVITVY